MFCEPLMRRIEEHVNEPEIKDRIIRKANELNMPAEELATMYVNYLYEDCYKQLNYIFLRFLHGMDKTNEPADHTIHYITRQNQKYLSAETHREKLAYCGGGLYRRDMDLEEMINDDRIG